MNKNKKRNDKLVMKVLWRHPASNEDFVACQITNCPKFFVNIPGQGFDTNAHRFVGSCGVIIKSSAYPEYTPGYHAEDISSLFVWGESKSLNSKTFRIPVGDIAKVRKAILEFNVFALAKGRTKPATAERTAEKTNIAPANKNVSAVLGRLMALKTAYNDGIKSKEEEVFALRRKIAEERAQIATLIKIMDRLEKEQ